MITTFIDLGLWAWIESESEFPNGGIMKFKALVKKQWSWDAKTTYFQGKILFKLK